MGVDYDHVSHLSGTYIVNSIYSGSIQEGAPNRIYLVLIYGAIHQIVKCLPTELPTHLDNHDTYYQGRNGIEDWVSGQIAYNADSND